MELKCCNSKLQKEINQFYKSSYLSDNHFLFTSIYVEYIFHFLQDDIELLADQFYLVRQLDFQKRILAFQFLFARYFRRLAREVDSLYWHCLMMVAFDALFHQLDQVIGFILSSFVFANPNFGVYCRW
ncbi:Hypothetical_protein [Hexamita inflata]|uniref:Hypothetical_protein n=1 Tax=Hexamita inflata TaxID=28002 RepID=A0AA86TT01_9EUKA|nr:Hypothetical protein HINF_LOCUS8898 [Hexamita inflata]